MGRRSNTIPAALHRLRQLRKGPLCLTAEITTSASPLSKLRVEDRDRLREDFHLWWDSWVAPEIAFLEARAVRKGAKAKRMAAKHAPKPVPAGNGRRHEDDRDCSDDTMIGYRGETEH
jgi:hypothetical protein